jgi:hypothetical protein
MSQVNMLDDIHVRLPMSLNLHSSILIWKWNQVSMMPFVTATAFDAIQQDWRK